MVVRLGGGWSSHPIRGLGNGPGTRYGLFAVRDVGHRAMSRAAAGSLERFRGDMIAAFLDHGEGCVGTRKQIRAAATALPPGADPLKDIAEGREPLPMETNPEDHSGFGRFEAHGTPEQGDPASFGLASPRVALGRKLIPPVGSQRGLLVWRGRARERLSAGAGTRRWR